MKIAMVSFIQMKYDSWYANAMAEWQFDYSYCALGRQHLWWAAWGFNLGTAVWVAIIGILHAAESLYTFETRRRKFLVKKTN